jgi:hypothetical protein
MKSTRWSGRRSTVPRAEIWHPCSQSRRKHRRQACAPPAIDRDGERRIPFPSR